MTPRLGIEPLEPRDVPSAANVTFVTNLYEDLLHRAPDSAGLAAWVGVLDSGARSRAQVADNFLDSPEFRSNLIRSYYANILGRAPDAAGFNTYMAQLQAGVSRDALVASFFASDEFYARFGRNPSTFVSQLYAQMLGRTGSAAEVVLWMNALALNGGNRAAVVAQFVTSSEYRQNEVRAAYHDFLQRPPDPQGFADWYSQRAAGLPVESMDVQFLGSAEYFVRV